jgi:protein O-GlcNAc transferase
VASAVQRALEKAFQSHQAGRLDHAETGYRRVLQSDPTNADALHLLGVLLHQQGQHEPAIASIEKALRFRPSNPYMLSDLGSAYAGLNRTERAETCFRTALALAPSLVEAHNNLGNMLSDQGKLAEAEASYRQAIELEPGYVEAWANLGAVLAESSRYDEALSHYERALALNPNLPEIHNNLGNAELALGRFAQAESRYHRALSLNPDFALSHCGLGRLQRLAGHLVAAENSCRRAIALAPDLADAHCSLGDVLKDQGRLEEAIECYRKAITAKPGLAEAHASILVALDYLPGAAPEAIFQEHLDFAQRFFPALPRDDHANAPDPERRLRLGYVSGDLREHPVAQFLEPVLARHDASAFQVFCYSTHHVPDAATARLQALCPVWRQLTGLDDDAAVQAIEADGIDILVDLSGHTAFNRLAVFARKPAPVQVTWLGYLNTTGLSAMDYRITDHLACPDAGFDALHSERLARLPHSQWCYQPPAECPAVVPSPAVASGTVTFACFANLAKIGPHVIELWSELLQRVPGSRLLLVRRGLTSLSEDYLARFRAHGIAEERILLEEAKPFREYLELHGRADIVLDTFPYAGGTTTCHALWMGVPVVSFAGRSIPSRSGASLLTAAGLGHLAAESTGEYLEIAQSLARDLPALAALRAGMRARLQTSPLMDGETFTRDLEQAYRSMWRAWCQGEESPRPG